MEHEAEKKRHAKRQVEVIKRWTRLIQGLRIRDRLLKEYGDRQPTSSVNDVKAVDADDVQLEEVCNCMSLLHLSLEPDYPPVSGRACRPWRIPNERR